MEISTYFGYRKDLDLSLLFKIFIILNAVRTYIACLQIFFENNKKKIIYI